MQVMTHYCIPSINIHEVLPGAGCHQEVRDSQANTAVAQVCPVTFFSILYQHRYYW